MVGISVEVLDASETLNKALKVKGSIRPRGAG